MGKRVILIVSGETERRALPHLASHLRNQGVSVTDVLIPPRNRALKVEMAQSLIRAAWYGSFDSLPDKFVVLVDTDGKSPSALAPFRDLPGRLRHVEATVLFAYAQWHLEAWYFGDAGNLRDYLGGALGSVDTSKPDEIENPKLHLRKLLLNQRGAVYTARVSEAIAGKLDARTIVQRSPSFRRFIDAIMNGDVAADSGCV